MSTSPPARTGGTRRSGLIVALALGAVVLLIGVTIILVLVLSDGDDSESGTAGAGTTSQTEPAVPSPEDATEEPAPTGETEYSITWGDPDAERHVVIYEDFQCPHCQEFAETGHEDLAELAEDGEIYLEYRPFNLLNAPYSKGALNALAVVQEAYPNDEVTHEFHEALFEEQPAPGDATPTPEDLLALAVDAGAERSEVQDILDPTSRQEFVEGATEQAESEGVPGTPTVILDGQQFSDGATAAELAENLVDQLSE